MEDRRQLLKHPGLDPLWKGLERDRSQRTVVAVCVLIAGVATLIFTLQHSLLWQVIGALIATGGLYWLFRILGGQPVRYWRRRLLEEPESIVWIYGEVTERMPFGLRLLPTATLFLVEASGESNAIGVSARDIKLVSKTLNRLLPDAEFGYTKERELRYRGYNARPPQIN